MRAVPAGLSPPAASLPRVTPRENFDDYAVQVLTDRLDQLTGRRQLAIALGHLWRRTILGPAAADDWLRTVLDVEWLQW